MNSYDSMKRKHLQTGLYKADNSTALHKELKAYAAGIDLVLEKLSQIQRECFIDTAEDYGLYERERFTGAVRDDLDIEKRREMLKTREQTNENTCSPSAFEKIVAGYGLYDFSITEYPANQEVTLTVRDSLSEDNKYWIEKMAGNDFPAHLNLNVVFN